MVNAIRTGTGHVYLQSLQKVQKVLSPTNHSGSSSNDSLVPALQILPISRDPEAELRRYVVAYKSYFILSAVSAVCEVIL